jgi:hypothetical protein
VARTLYEQDNADFSNRAHMRARDVLYPRIFNVRRERLQFEDTLLAQSDRAKILDGEMGVDRIVHVTIHNLPAPLMFTVQERFRRPEFAKYQDMTVTEWNHASNLPSELYKINAGLFLYGYFDERTSVFVDAIAIGVTDMLLAIATRRLRYNRRWNKKRQTFLTLRFDDMERAGIVRFRLDNTMMQAASAGGFFA